MRGTKAALSMYLAVCGTRWPRLPTTQQFSWDVRSRFVFVPRGMHISFYDSADTTVRSADQFSHPALKKIGSLFPSTCAW